MPMMFAKNETEKTDKVEMIMRMEQLARDALIATYQLLYDAAAEIAFTDRELALELVKNKDQLHPHTALAKLFRLAETLGIRLDNQIALYATSPLD
jgi:hypothetical protein